LAKNLERLSDVIGIPLEAERVFKKR